MIPAILGTAQALFGIGQSIFSGRKKAERNLNKQIDAAPKTTANKSILDFYNNALQRYGVDPTSSSLYKTQQQNIGRNVASGVASMQDRRLGNSGISSLLRAANDASLNSVAAAEQQRDQRFGVLGNATNMSPVLDGFYLEKVIDNGLIN